MGFKDYKNVIDNYPIVLNGKVDTYFKVNYGFKYTSYSMGYGDGLEKLIPLKNGDYLRVYLTSKYIYLYQEYNCGGKVCDAKFVLKELDIWGTNGKIDEHKIEDILDKLIDKFIDI